MNKLKGGLLLVPKLCQDEARVNPKEILRKRRFWQVGCGGLMLVLLSIQFVPGGRSSRATQLEPDLNLPEPLKDAVRRCCFDCHSDVGAVPWYGRIAPISWWIDQEVKTAQATMDYSAWDRYSERRQALFWRRSLERIRRGTMPPPRYAQAHSEFNSEEFRALREYVKSLPEWRLGTWTADELLAWPKQEWKGGAVRGVVTTERKVLEETLTLEGGALLVDGDLTLARGVTGEGALLVTGQLQIREQNQSVGPVLLVSLVKLSLSGSGGGQVQGVLVSQQRRELDGVALQEEESMVLEVDGVRETSVDFCRADGEIGEVNERTILVRYAEGEFVIWEPEFEEVVRASSQREALEAVAALMSRDSLTSLEDFHARFRQDWVALLAGLPERTPRARLASHPLLLVDPQPGTGE